MESIAIHSCKCPQPEDNTNNALPNGSGLQRYSEPSLTIATDEAVPSVLSSIDQGRWKGLGGRHERRGWGRHGSVGLLQR
jgi:hypothetical protein